MLSAAIVSMPYCGVCTTMGYETPLFGFSQNVGAVWKLPAKESCSVFAASLSDRPTSAAMERSKSTFNVGALKAC